VHAYLFFLVLGFTLALFPSTVFADEQSVVAASLEYQNNPEPAQINERKAGSGVAMSSLGIVFSTVGIIAGGVLAVTPECRWQGGGLLQTGARRREEEHSRQSPTCHQPHRSRRIDLWARSLQSHTQEG
jgi:hypothetical protein